MNDYKKDFGLFLKKSRENVGLTQEKAADIIGVSKTTIGKWENEGTKPDDVNLETIIEIYKLNKEIFKEKYCNAFILPPTEIEKKKDRKFPWPDCMPLEKWMGTSMLENLKNLQLNELETELLGLEEIYSFNGTINLDTTELTHTISGSVLSSKDNHKHNMIGNINLSEIPYDFIKSHGVFNVKNAKRKLDVIFSNNKLKSLVLEHFSKNPNNKTFDICDLTEKEFYLSSSCIDAIGEKGKCSLYEIVFNAIEILGTIEKHNNKYCLFDGIETTELSDKKDGKNLFTDENLYDLFIPNEKNNIHWCKNMYVQPITLFSDFIEMKEELITDNLEYLEYKNKLKFYEENKNKGATKPKEPIKTGLYIVPTEKGKEFLNWYRETIENNGGVI